MPPNLSKILLEWGLRDELAKVSTRVRASTFYSSEWPAPADCFTGLIEIRGCVVVETGEPIGYLEWKEDVIQETGADFLLMAVRSFWTFHVTEV